MSWHINERDFFLSEQKYIGHNFPDLHFKEQCGFIVLIGSLGFSASFMNYPIEDTYKVNIFFPKDYPKSIPFTKEMGSRIDHSFHTNSDGTLCLGVPLEIYNKFQRKPCLHTYIETLLVPFLYSHSYFEKLGKMPWGGSAHGTNGVLHYYQELFHTNDVRIIVEIMDLLLHDKYKGRGSCPCNSKKALMDCHGLSILSSMKFPKNILKQDIVNLRNIVNWNTLNTTKKAGYILS